LTIGDDHPDARALLAPDATRAEVAGATDLRIIAGEIVAEGDRLGAFVTIPDGECALFLARATPQIGDVDMFVFEDDGATFASDEGQDATATLMVCPPHPKRLYVTARVMSGMGLVGVAALRVAKASADAVTNAVHARGRPGDESGKLESWPGLEARTRAHRAALGGHWEDMRRIAAPADPRVPTRVATMIDDDRCTDVLATPSDEVGSFELVAEDAEGRVVARGQDAGRDKFLVLCGGARAEVSLMLRPRGTAGIIALSIARSPSGGEAELSRDAHVVHLAATKSVDEERRALDDKLAGKGYGAAKVVGNGNAKVGARTALTLDLPAGCARLDVIAGKPAADLSASLWTDRGELLAEGSGGVSAPLFTCGKGGHARLDLEAHASPGPFTTTLRTIDGAPPALTAHATAASHLLARSPVGAQLSGLQVVAVEAGKRATLTTPIAKGACVDALVALDAGGVGVDLRFAPTGATEVTHAHAERVASARLCATDKPLSASLEIALATGKADALVLFTPSLAP
jgi:hypothetical protein